VATQDDVRRISLALADTSEDPNNFRFFRDGRQFVWAWQQRVDPKKRRVPSSEVIAVRTAGEMEKQDLLSLDPDVFFTEAHYDGYPAVLVRLEAIDDELLAVVLRQAWESRAQPSRHWARRSRR
jgi:hypothetical protein